MQLHPDLDVITAENPLDHVEEILHANNWAYSRMTDDELSVKIESKTYSYDLIFIWQPRMNALQFWCHYDLMILRHNLAAASLTLMDVNTALWMGHFEVARDTLIPAFRQTLLLGDFAEGGHIDKPLEDLVTIALSQCERFRPVFEILSCDENAAPDSIALALMETVGES